MISPVSWFMQKNSSFTPFIGHMLNKMAESGITNILTKRHLVAEPNCKPVRETGQSLGMKKFASLFTLYLIGCFIAIVIFVIELIFKPKKTERRHLNQTTTEIAHHKLKVKIEDFQKKLVMNHCDLSVAKKMSEEILREVKSLIERSSRSSSADF